MKAHLSRRITRLSASVPPGCPACRDWPLVWIMGEGDPGPPGPCERCGREWQGLVRVYLVDLSIHDV